VFSRIKILGHAAFALQAMSESNGFELSFSLSDEAYGAAPESLQSESPEIPEYVLVEEAV